MLRRPGARQLLEQASRGASHDESSSRAPSSPSATRIRGNNAVAHGTGGCRADGEPRVWREGRWGWERHGCAGQRGGGARLPLNMWELLAGGVAKTTPACVAWTLLAMPLQDLLRTTAAGAHTRVSAVAGDPGPLPHTTT